MARKPKTETQNAAQVENTPAPGAEDVAPAKRGNVVPTKYKERYKEHGGSCGDELAGKLAAAVNIGEKGATSNDALVEVGAANGVDVMGKWGHVNIGQRRMNLGNVLRGKLKRGERVVVGTDVWNADAEPAKKAG